MIETMSTSTGLPVEVLRWSGDEQEIREFCGDLFSHVDDRGRARVRIPPLGDDAIAWVPRGGYVVKSDREDLYLMFFMPGSPWVAELFIPSELLTAEGLSKSVQRRLEATGYLADIAETPGGTE